MGHWDGEVRARVRGGAGEGRSDLAEDAERAGEARRRRGHREALPTGDPGRARRARGDCERQQAGLEALAGSEAAVGRAPVPRSAPLDHAVLEVERESRAPGRHGRPGRRGGEAVCGFPGPRDDLPKALYARHAGGRRVLGRVSAASWREMIRHVANPASDRGRRLLPVVGGGGRLSAAPGRCTPPLWPAAASARLYGRTGGAHSSVP
mmetsp:Transcript_49567/g.115229  ORF Transcript_49567/g.115229 Transcript_49567/m.115229 type:complete len:208 (+) Transcript_49567:583-1206(+)